LDNYRIYGLIIVRITKKLIMLDYGFSNATFEPLNHVFVQRKACLWARGSFGLSKNLGPKRHPNT
jgi:hypothetical protein